MPPPRLVPSAYGTPSRTGAPASTAPDPVPPDPAQPPGRQAGAAEMRLVHLLRRLTLDLDLLGAAFAERHGLHPTDVRALIHVLDADRQGGAATPGSLRTALGMTSASVTALLDRLERVGLVRRQRDDRDRRRVRLVVEDRAVDLGQTFFGPVIGALLTVMDEFTTEELGVVDRFLAEGLAAVAELRGTNNGDGTTEGRDG